MKAKKIIKQLCLLLAALLIIATFYYMWQQSQPEPDVYKVLKPQTRDISNQVTATGTIEPRTQIEIKPQVTGRISELRVKAGDYVHSGDIIAVITIIPDMSQLNQAQNNVESAIIQLKQAQRDAARSQALYEDGVVSKADNEQAQTQLATCRDNVAAARSQVDVINKGVSTRSGKSNTTIVRSTMNGTVLELPVKIGTMVSGASSFSEGTTIAKIGDMSDVIFSGDIDETLVSRVQLGMEMTLVPGAMQEVKIPAILEYISPEGKLQNGTRRFEIKAKASIPHGVNVRSGYSINATIQLDKVNNALAIDEVCVTYKNDKAYVYKLTSAPDDSLHQTWQEVPVTLGISDGLYVQVKSGVTQSMMLRGNKR